MDVVDADEISEDDGFHRRSSWLGSSACRACKKPISGKVGDNLKTKSACFGLLRELCVSAPPGALGEEDVRLVAEAAGRGLAEKSQSLKLEGAKLRTPRARRRSVLSTTVPRAIEAVQAEWYKLIKGVALCVAVAELVRPIDADMVERRHRRGVEIMEAAWPRSSLVPST